MLAYFKFEFAVVAWYKTIEKPHYGYMAVSFVPTIVYSVAIIVMNQLYRPLAIKLNEWGENPICVCYAFTSYPTP